MTLPRQSQMYLVSSDESRSAPSSINSLRYTMRRKQIPKKIYEQIGQDLQNASNKTCTVNMNIQSVELDLKMMFLTILSSHYTHCSLALKTVGRIC